MEAEKTSLTKELDEAKSEIGDWKKYASSAVFTPRTKGKVPSADETIPPLEAAGGMPKAPEKPTKEGAAASVSAGAWGASAGSPKLPIDERIASLAHLRMEPTSTPETRDTRMDDRPGGRKDTSSRVRVLTGASKVIRIKLTKSDDIIEYLDNMTKMKHQIEDIYYDEDERLKIQIAMNQCEGSVRTDSETVYEKCKEARFFCLEDFFTDLFKLAFPASQSTLAMGFRNIKQGSGTIVDFGRKFRTVIGLLKYDINSYFFKFLEGLQSNELRTAIHRQNLEGMGFDQLVTLAVSINNNLVQEKASSKVFFGEEKDGQGSEMGGARSGVVSSKAEREFLLWARKLEGGKEEGEEQVFKIFDRPLRDYLEKARNKGLDGRCFICFSKSHRSLDCKVKACKFCHKEIKVVKHLSIFCKKAPEDFSKFFDLREHDGSEKVGYTGAFESDEFESD